MRVAVVGGGVIGLSTAVNFAEVYPNANVTVFAEDFLKNTVSYVSGGIFGPTVERAPTKDLACLERWTADTAGHFKKLAVSADCDVAGVNIFNLIELWDYERKERPFFWDHVFNCRWLTSNEIKEKRYPNFVKSGVSIVTTITENRFYLPYTREKLKRASRSCAFIERRVENFRELADEGYDLVFNCSGMGAGKLCNDKEVFPVRGQVMRVVAPWIKHGVYGPQSTYIFPCRNSVILGGVYQADNYNPEVSAEDRAGILQRTAQYFPSLKGARVVEERATFRPTRRSGTRVELEQVGVSSRTTIPVVHNYGHSSNGVGLSWGSAVHAVELASEHFRMPNKKAKL